MSAQTMLAEARKCLGLSGRPNKITREYASNHGAVFLEEPWCDMSITYWARHSGNAAAVLPGGDRAYTVWHAQDFQKIGRWHEGTASEVNRSKPGCIVFFDWGATNDVGAIDHVGIIEKVLGGGRVQTIEGNTGDACKRKVRDFSVIAGYGDPDYGKAGTSASEEDDMLGLKKGDKGDRVEFLQRMLLSCGQKLPKFGVDGDYGDEVSDAVRAVRLQAGSDAAKTDKKIGDSVTPTAAQQIWWVFAKAANK